MANRNPAAPASDVVSPTVQNLSCTRDDLIKRYPMLSAAQLRALPRLPAEGEGDVETIVRLAEEWKVTVPTASVGEVRQRLVEAAELAPILSVVEEIGRVVRNALLGSQSRARQGALTFYSVLSRVAKHEPRLRARLRPLRQSMSQKARQSRKRQAEASSTRSKAMRQLKKAVAAQIDVRSGSPATVDTTGVVVANGTNGAGPAPVSTRRDA